TSLIFLYAYSPITGNAILSSQLDQTAYDAGEKITGTISLQMQEGDILPEDSKISIIISGDQTKCQTKYVCPILGEVDWYRVNITSGECYLPSRNADPESLCCSANSANCNQIIKNSGFENELNSWVFSRTGDSAATKSVEELTLLDEEGNQYYDSMTAKLSTEGISNTASATLTQTFATPLIVESLVSDKPNLIVSDLRYSQDNFELTYNITICNGGYGKTTKPFIVKTTIQKLLGGTIETKNYQITQNLSVGQCISNIIKTYKESGNYSLNVTVDYLPANPISGSILETNELDNTKQITINNYYIKNLYFSAINVTYDGFLSINYTIQICNDYNQTLPAFNVSIYSPTSNSNPWGLIEPTIYITPNTNIQFNEIPMGACSKQSKIYSIVVLNPPYPAILNPLVNGTYSYWLWIDKENVINDRLEDNKLFGDFKVGTTGWIPDERAIYSTDIGKNNFEQEEEKVLLFDTTPYSTSTGNFSLGWMAYTDAESYYGCAFEIVVKGEHLNTERRLHYYYKISDICSAPLYNATDVYFSSNYDSATGLIDVYTDLYSNWMAAYPNDGILDSLTGIYLTSWGKVSNTNIYGQSVYFDNIRLDKTSKLQPTEEMSCEAKDKVCCLEGAGSGVYYGEQLSCSEGHECWEKCSQKEFTLKEFIAASSNSSKYNKTEGDCRVYVDSVPIDLLDSCESDFPGCGDCVGEGYTACLDTSATAKTSCKNWDNIYSVNLSKLNLYAPSSNGTYSVNLLFTYKTTDASLGETIDISTFELPLIVGAGEPPVVPTCLEAEYINCTGTWSDCDSYNTKRRNATCYYSGIQSCPPTKSIPQTEQCYIQSNVTTCTEYDWNCGLWSTCEGGSQIRTCNLIGISCDPTMYGSYVPEQQQGCTIREEGTGFEVKYLIYGGIGIILLVGIFFLIKFLMSQEAKKESSSKIFEPLTSKIGKDKEKIEKKEDYPELSSYIKDALAAGMNPSEIRLKLQEAGWPKNIIDSIFKKFE
ncbi:hypothetical protein J4465_01300, partial [Candidatus Pacearchaeota archaeon]|nr:hypothetical protein [Candidatus Pacearchaeota archaeon]